jgi:hypothetical protein
MITEQQQDRSMQLSMELMDKQIEEIEAHESQDNPVPNKEGTNVFTIFQEILDSKDSIKTSNMELDQIGDLKYTSAGLLDIGLLAETLGDKNVADYLRGRAEIVLASNMSKKGWFTDRLISQNKSSTRNFSGTSAQNLPKKKGILGLFGAKEKEVKTE